MKFNIPAFSAIIVSFDAATSFQMDQDATSSVAGCPWGRHHPRSGVVNQSGGAKPAAHLLKYDSILGTFDADVKVVDDATITVNGKPIKVVSDRGPLNLPWKEMGIDIVIEGTGVS